MYKGYLTIELTSSRIRYMLLGRKGRGYEVLKCGFLPFALNISAPGDLTRQLQEVIKREALHPQKLFVTLGFQENFIRQVHMPKMNVKEMEEAITAEIEKYPSYSKRQFDYIYDVSNLAKSKGNVVFAAIEQSVLNYVLSECQKLGIPFQHLEIAPLNIKEIIHLIEPSVDNQTILVVNDTVSYLMIARGLRYQLIYKVGIGIEHLYPHRNDQISETNVFNLIGELQRVLKSYLSQHRLERLNKIWLVWDKQGAAGFNQAMHGQLGLDVEVLSLEQIAKFGESVDPNAANPAYMTGVTPAIIDLENIKEQFPLNHFFRALHFKRYVFQLLAASLFSILIAGYFLGMKSLEFMDEQKSIKAEIVATTDAINTLKATTTELYRQRDEYLAVRQGLLDQANYIKTLNRVAWSQVLSVFAEEMPKDMALTSFKFNETGKVSFFGDSLEVETVSELIRRIDTSAILEKGMFDFFTEKVVDEQKIYSFGILAQLQDNPETEPEQGEKHE